MKNPYSKSFDELLSGILTDYQNQIDPETGAPIDGRSLSTRPFNSLDARLRFPLPR